MKKLMTIVGIASLGALLVVPAMVWAQGWGPGHMRGFWGRGSGYRPNGNYAQVTPEQNEKLADLNRKFFDDTQELRSQLWSKRTELSAALSQANPDTAKVDELQKQISDLRSQLDQKRINYQLEARKIAPEASGPAYGYGYGYGPQMRGYGPGYGMGYGPGYGMMSGPGYGRGYGPGACWNY